ncbi:hypothetical protein T492DRAFT_889848, partial [Pavlovales sp. CCMP2436]
MVQAEAEPEPRPWSAGSQRSGDLRIKAVQPSEFAPALPERPPARGNSRVAALASTAAAAGPQSPRTPTKAPRVGSSGFAPPERTKPQTAGPSEREELSPGAFQASVELPTAPVSAVRTLALSLALSPGGSNRGLLPPVNGMGVSSLDIELSARTPRRVPPSVQSALLSASSAAAKAAMAAGRAAAIEAQQIFLRETQAAQLAAGKAREAEAAATQGSSPSAPVPADMRAITLAATESAHAAISAALSAANA